MESIVLDTDIAMGIHGEDIDDGFALAFAVLDPLLDLRLVSTVDGNIDVDTASQQARFLLERLGVQVPVVRGADRPLCGRRRKYWGVLNDTTDNPAQDIPAAMRIVQLLRESPDGLTIIAIGPLTNIALALLLDPTVRRRINRLVIMGGRYYHTDWGTGIPGEYNFWADPEAVRIILDLNLDMWLVGTDVTFQVLMNRQEIDAIRTGGGSFGSYAADCAQDWLNDLNARSYKPVEGFPLHDPLAVAAATHPDIIEWRDEHVNIILDGHARGVVYLNGDGPVCHVAHGVNVPLFKQYMFARFHAI